MITQWLTKPLSSATPSRNCLYKDNLLKYLVGIIYFVFLKPFCIMLSLLIDKNTECDLALQNLLRITMLQVLILSLFSAAPIYYLSLN